jgi:pimeloyl-ACP methyl ester carboxylesterase
MTPPPLIMLPGLGADARMYRAQKEAFPQLVTPDWIPPKKQESLAEYAQRFLQSLDLQGPYFLGGASFGGMIAYEMALAQPPRGLFLLSSARSPQAMTNWLRRIRSIAHITQILPWDAASLVAELGLGLPDRLLPFRVKMVLKHLHHDETDFMRWGLPAVLRWKPSELASTFPIHQLHGERDPFLPAKLSQADLIVPKAGHLLTKTHAEEVNRFIAERIAD